MNIYLSTMLVLVGAWLLWSLSWHRRASLADGWGRAHERHDLAFSTGSSAGPPLTPEQVAALRELTSPETRARILMALAKLGVPRQDREDVAQEIAVAIVRSIHRYDPELGKLDRWLNAFVVHVASRQLDLARHRREELQDEPGEDLLDEAVLVDASIERAEAMTALLGSLHHLSEAERTIVVRHELGAEPIADLAREMQEPLSNMYRWKREAIAKLGTVVRIVTGVQRTHAEVEAIHRRKATPW